MSRHLRETLAQAQELSASAKRSEEDVEPADGDFSSPSTSFSYSRDVIIKTKRGSETSLNTSPNNGLRPAATRPSIASPLKHMYTVSQKATTQDLSGAFCCRFHPDGNTFAIGYGNGTSRIYNSETGERLGLLQPVGLGAKEQLPITCLRYNPIHKHILTASGTDGSIRHWSTESFTLVKQHLEENEIHAIDYLCDGSKFLTGGKDMYIRCYDYETGRVLGTYHPGEHTELGHNSRIFSIRSHNESPNIFVSGGWDRSLKVWDVRAKHVVRLVRGPHICGDSVDLKGNMMLTGSWSARDSLQLWDFRSSNLLQTIELNDLPSTYTSSSSLLSTSMQNLDHVATDMQQQQVKVMQPVDHTKSPDYDAYFDDMDDFNNEGQSKSEASSKAATANSPILGQSMTPKGLRGAGADPLKLYCAQFYPRGAETMIACGGSGANAVKIVDGDTYEVTESLGPYAKPVTCLHFSPCGRYMVHAAGEDMIQVSATTWKY
eukprot:Colp12_sorted_trinity150504_noHs@35996